MFERNAERVLQRARTGDDVRRLLDALDLLDMGGPHWREPVWAALVPVAIAHPNPAREGDDVLDIVFRVPPPTVDAAAALLQLPMLDFDTEWFVLQGAGRLARTFFVDYWDFVEWSNNSRLTP